MNQNLSNFSSADLPDGVSKYSGPDCILCSPVSAPWTAKLLFWCFPSTAAQRLSPLCMPEFTRFLFLPGTALYVRFLSCGICQWKYSERVWNVSMGLQRCRISVPRNHPSWLCSAVVCSRIDFEKSLRKHLEKMIPLVYDCARENFYNFPHQQGRYYMRHLMSPLDLTKEELDDLLTLASDIEKIQSNTRMSAMISDLPPVFTNQVHVHD